MMNQVVVSQQTGYARNASESAYPNLWRGLVGWWCPSINPRGGNRLFDLSPFRNDGTLTNMANDDWVVSEGQGALDFDGTNDFVATKTPFRLLKANGFSVTAFVRLNSTSSKGTILKTGLGGVQSGFGFGVGAAGNSDATGNNLVYVFEGVAFASTALQFTTDWNFVVLTVKDSLCRLYLNNVKGTDYTGTTNDSATNDFNIGGYNILGINRWFNSGQIDDVRAYNRILTEPEMRQLASRRGIGLQPARPLRIPEEIAAAGVANPVLFYNHYTNQGFF